MKATLTIRVRQLLQVLNTQIYGKEQILALSLLSAVAGESIFLLGPPGVAKSMIARRLKLAFSQGTSFEYLMSRFSTPDEIFGPVSISKLKDEDSYERITEGYLPDATVVFLDEIWKAGPAIQNALLTVLNERIYRNGKKLKHLPLKGLIAASNELPAPGQGLEALWDRFLIRTWVGGIEDLSDFDRMISSTDDNEPVVPEELLIHPAEYAVWQQAIAEVKIPYAVFDVIHLLKEKIEEYNRGVQNDGQLGAPLYVSDRRWKKWVKLLRTAAYLNGESEIHISDCMLLSYGIWSGIEHMEIVEEMVHAAISKSVDRYILDLHGIEMELNALREELSSHATLRERFDPGLQLMDSYYYQVERVRMPGKLWMFASDYQHLDDTGKLFYLHKDKYKSDCFILKKYDVSLNAKVPKNKIYSLRRGRRSVFINNYEYPLLCIPNCEPLPAIEVQPEEDLQNRFIQLEQRICRIEGGASKLLETEVAYCRSHLFLSQKQQQTLLDSLTSQQSKLIRYRNELNELKHVYRKENEEYPAE